MPDWESERRIMIENQLRGRGILDERVLAAMGAIPREQFLGPEHQEFAYQDRALPATCGQTLSQPYVVAKMSEVLEVQPGMKVLEVGTGTGYQAAVLLMLGADLWTIERIAELNQAAGRRLSALGLDQVHLLLGDGSLGHAPQAPFDRIIVTAAAPSIPNPLLNQLRQNGRMVIPVGSLDDQAVVLLEKGAHSVIETPIFPCRFVKLVGEAGWSP